MLTTTAIFPKGMSEELGQIVKSLSQPWAGHAGPQHDASSLQNILEGSMLERWTAHVADSADSKQ